jgi:hypothetical protein
MRARSALKPFPLKDPHHSLGMNQDDGARDGNRHRIQNSSVELLVPSEALLYALEELNRCCVPACMTKGSSK